MMNPEIKSLWTAALRSGDYEQGRMKLNINGKFCCLGVLCDLHSKATNTPWNYTIGTNYMCTDTPSNAKVGAYLREYNVLPQPVTEWAGLLEQNPTILVRKLDRYSTDELSTLSIINDEAVTFEEIANLIEEQL